MLVGEKRNCWLTHVELQQNLCCTVAEPCRPVSADADSGLQAAGAVYRGSPVNIPHASVWICEYTADYLCLLFMRAIFKPQDRREGSEGGRG